MKPSTSELRLEEKEKEIRELQEKLDEVNESRNNVRTVESVYQKSSHLASTFVREIHRRFRNGKIKGFCNKFSFPIVLNRL